MAGRIVRERCVLLLGKSGAGKSTVANHLVGHDPLSPDKPPFKVLHRVLDSVTLEVQHKTVEFMWENDLYRVTVVDTIGFYNEKIHGNNIVFDKFVQYIAENKLRIDLILFVCKKGSFTREGKRVISFIRAEFLVKLIPGCPKNISPISALVFTGCETDIPITREVFVQEFMTDPSTREIANQMGMGIYTVGFPPLRCPRMLPTLQQAYKEVILQDQDTLRELIVRVNADGERGKWQCDE